MQADTDDIVVLPIESSLDLHPFAPQDIPAVVEEYLLAARAAGLREVRLIHGRGIGVQRARVQALVARLPWVEAAAEATADLGGWGATSVVLRPPESENATG
ncbi:MAG TPA: Smr/MutS family protein [Thermoanaerobaculaceae bacterium]|nr:Smr/MutS family protein [Thermoanaerobaculaceae bacterium]HPS78733.1 Smr/MutS family protein [Thermoanaerobaculaceae bacterium]